MLSDFLHFGLAERVLAFPIDSVRDITAWKDLPCRARSPNHTRGAMKFQGRLVPVLDLRAHFGLERSRDESGAVVIVVQLHRGTARAVTIGCLVDAIIDVSERETIAMH
jgi:purine-binding chemotaxis protein CheW